jgi:hypothetical protein
MIPLTEQVAEARRELALRRQCYPKRIKSGRLSMEEANRQLLAMSEIVRTLERLEIE